MASGKSSPVPDELNLYKAPGMRARFSRMAWQTNRIAVFSLPAWISNWPVTLDQLQAMPEFVDDGGAAPGMAVSRERLIEWFAQQDEEYRLLLEACVRPQMRFDADYTNPSPVAANGMDMPNFVNLRSAAQALATHANLNLVDGRPDVAVQDLHVLRRLADLSGSSPVLVGAMIRAAILRLHADTARDAILSGLLEEGHIASIQEQIRDVNLLADFKRSCRAERAIQVRLMTQEPGEVLKTYQHLLATPDKPFWRFSIDDWEAWHEAMKFKREIRSRRRTTESLTLICRFTQKALDQLNTKNGRIHPAEISLVLSNTIHNLRWDSDEHRLAAIVLPNYLSAARGVAQNQTRLDQLYVACALERHRLAHGSYPETLDALLPEFLDHIPNDLFADQPLQYRFNPDGSHDLWSVGWDETDNSGRPSFDKSGEPIYDDKQGDWVWTSPRPRTAGVGPR